MTLQQELRQHAAQELVFWTSKIVGLLNNPDVTATYEAAALCGHLSGELAAWREAIKTDLVYRSFRDNQVHDRVRAAADIDAMRAEFEAEFGLRRRELIGRIDEWPA